MGKRGKRAGGDGPVATALKCVGRGRSLEVVSKEHFMMRREGMAEVSSCCDCQRQRTETSSGQASRKCHRRRAHGRLHSPVIMRLGDSINVSVKNKLKNAEDSDASSDDGSYSSDSNMSYLNSGLTSYIYGQQQHGYYYGDDSKNLNAFLSAIEKVHQKDTTDLSSTLNNLDENVPCSKKSTRVSSPTSTLARTAMLNNLLHYHSHATTVGGSTCQGSSRYSKRNGFVPFESDNVEVICNDLHSGGTTTGDGQNVNWDEYEGSEESSSVVSSSESSTEYDTASRSDYDELSCEELHRLTSYATGYDLTQYNCMSAQCTTCVASQSATNFAYQLWMPEYYAQGNDLLKVDSGMQEYGYESYEDYNKCSSGSDNECCSVVVSTGPGKVEVSVSLSRDKGKHNIRRRRHLGSTGSNWQATPFATLNTVSIDLTDSDVTFSVHYPPSDSPAATYQTPATSMASYPSSSMYGNMYSNNGSDYSPYAAYPYDMMAPSLAAPYGVYQSPYAPSAYYMYPMVSIPAPLCVPRNLKCLESQCLCMVPAQEIRNFTASQPPQRPWIQLTHIDTTHPVAVYMVMCYNVLCDKYATRQLYGYCPSWALSWDYRKKAILEEIRHYSADIVSLQEVETEQFYKFFLPELKKDGYHGIFSPKSRARTMSEAERKHVDGCAIFFRTSKFTLVKEHLVEFNQLAMASAEGSHDMINRVMTKDNIGLAALLETRDTVWENGLPLESQVRQPLLVATCHVHWDPEYCDVKLIQTMILMSELKNIIEESQRSFRPGSTAPACNNIPLILCGDFNSLPDSGVVEFLNSGRVPANHEDFKDLGYEDCLRNLSTSDNKDTFTHGFNLMLAYANELMPYTNYTFDFKGVIDYVFLSREFMRPLGVLGPLDQEWYHNNKVLGCPHPHVPSDHLPLLVEIEMSAGPTALPTSLTAAGKGGKNSSSSGSSGAAKGNNFYLRR